MDELLALDGWVNSGKEVINGESITMVYKDTNGAYWVAFGYTDDGTVLVAGIYMMGGQICYNLRGPKGEDVWGLLNHINERLKQFRPWLCFK